MSLKEKALLVKVGVHKASFEKRERGVAKKVAEEYEMNEALMKTRKSTFLKEDVQALKKVMNKVLPTVYENTLPYRDGGWRLLSVDLHEKLEEELRKISNELQDVKEEFRKNYENYKEKARKELGKLYNPLDYPPVDYFMSRFSFDTIYEPIPDSNDIRVDMEKDVVEKLRKELEDANERRLKKAVEEVWNRIVEALTRLHERLTTETEVDEEGNAKQPRLFKSLIENIRDLVDILPALNITNDAEMEEVRKKLDEEFAELDIKDLKEDEDLKKEVAKKAEELLENIENIM